MKTLLSPTRSCFIHHGVLHLNPNSFIHHLFIHLSKFYHSSFFHQTFIHLSWFFSIIHASLIEILFCQLSFVTYSFFSFMSLSTIIQPYFIQKIYSSIPTFIPGVFVNFFHQSFIQNFHSSRILFICVFHLSNVHLSSIYQLLNFHSYFQFIHGTHMLTISLVDVKL